MINVIDKNFYDKETINMINGFNDTTKNVVENNELSEQIDGMITSVGSVIDNLAHAAHTCPESIAKEKIYLAMTVFGAMLCDACDKHVKTNNEIEKLVKKIIEKITKED